MKKANKLEIIGSKTSVDFPKQGLLAVPAKIDTGADSSSIWATEIEEQGGTVSFVLFDGTSPWYTGQRIVVDTYSVRHIKNSFGVSEFRYKIALPVVFSNKKFIARFTLSNRKNNRYPILIGRQSLKNRFMVDVSKDSRGENIDTPDRVLVLVNGGSDVIKSFYREAEQRQEGKIVFDVRRYKDLLIRVEAGNVSATFIQDGVDVRSFDLVYFKTRIKNAELAAIVANVAKHENIAFLDKAASKQPTDTKMHQGTLLALCGITVPKTIHMDALQWENHYKILEGELGLPFIFKDNNGKKGRSNFLINNEADYQKALKDVDEQKLQMIAQRYIPNRGYYRVVVLGRRMALAMFRPVDQGVSHLYKKNRDGLPEYVEETELSSEAIRLAVQATDLLDLDVAGVDLLEDKDTGLWYCLEVNNSPQLVSGAFVTEKMNALTKFFREEIER